MVCSLGYSNVLSITDTVPILLVTSLNTALSLQKKINKTLT